MSSPMTKMILLVGLAVVFGTAMVALSVRRPASSSARHEWSSNGRQVDRTFQVKPGDKLVLDSDVGDVSIIGGESTELTIHAMIRGTDPEARKFNIDLDQNGSVVTVRGRNDRRMFHWFDNSDLEVIYEIHLPSNFNLRIETSGGDLSVENVGGNIVGETSGGDLTAANLSATIKMTTSGGSIKMRQLTGEMTMETSGGDIIGEDLAGTVKAQTSGGSIRLTRAGGQVNAETSGGDIYADLTENKGVDLSTSGGSIVVTLPKKISADLTAETSGGSISCDLEFSGRTEDDSWRGKIHGGGDRIRLETSGGDISLRSLD
jgi:DUF4097 and DUF4098 domain-containing protein YvlB